MPPSRLEAKFSCIGGRRNESSPSLFEATPEFVRLGSGTVQGFDVKPDGFCPIGPAKK